MRISQVDDRIGGEQPPAKVVVAHVGRDGHAVAEPARRRRAIRVVALDPPADECEMDAGIELRHGGEDGVQLLRLVQIAGGDDYGVGPPGLEGTPQRPAVSLGAAHVVVVLDDRVRHDEHGRAAPELLQIPLAERRVDDHAASAADEVAAPWVAKRLVAHGVGRVQAIAQACGLALRDEPERIPRRLQPTDEVVQGDVVEDDEPRRLTGEPVDVAVELDVVPDLVDPERVPRDDPLVLRLDGPDDVHRVPFQEPDAPEPLEHRRGVGRDARPRRRERGEEPEPWVHDGVPHPSLAPPLAGGGEGGPRPSGRRAHQSSSLATTSGQVGTRSVTRS